jgi:hypothetical protein
LQYFEPGGNSKNLETPWGIVLESGKKLRDSEGISYHYFSEIGALIIHSENYFLKNTTRKIARLRASQKKKRGVPTDLGVITASTINLVPGIWICGILITSIDLLY